MLAMGSVPSMPPGVEVSEVLKMESKFDTLAGIPCDICCSTMAHLNSVAPSSSHRSYLYASGSTVGTHIPRYRY